MKVVPSSEGWELELRAEEWRVLVAVLRLYPLIPGGHARIHRGDPSGLPDSAGLQQLLDDAVNAQRDTHRERLEAWLGQKPASLPRKGPVRRSVRREELEWFLQILNDLRVGSWIRLGCPADTRDAKTESAAEAVQLRLVMDLCGALQVALLRASGSSS